MSAQPHEVVLPAYGVESGLTRLIEMLSAAEGAPEVRVDFQRVKFYRPSAIVAVLARVKAWLVRGATVRFANHRECEAFRYLQRIDFFQTAGLNLPEDFFRRDRADRFVPVREISVVGSNIGVIATEITECFAPEGFILNPFYPLLQYALGEVLSNCKQHAKAMGFVAAQYTPRDDRVHFAVADIGIGIRESFRQSQSPHFRESMTDLEAVTLALRPYVSSVSHLPHIYGRPSNMGVGLSMLREITLKLHGSMFLASGRAWWTYDVEGRERQGDLTGESRWSGVICALSLRRNAVEDYSKHLAEARDALRLTSGVSRGTRRT